MSYAVVFIYRPTNSVATVWMTFETRAEAKSWAETRLTSNYRYEVRALCPKADWPAHYTVASILGGQ